MLCQHLEFGYEPEALATDCLIRHIRPSLTLPARKGYTLQSSSDRAQAQLDFQDGARSVGMVLVVHQLELAFVMMVSQSDKGDGQADDEARHQQN